MSSAIDPYSIWRFRFWRSLAMIFHVAFLFQFIRALDLGSSSVLLATFISAVLCTVITAVALHLYYLAARYLSPEMELKHKMRHLLSLVVIIAVHACIIKASEGDMRVLVMFCLHMTSFACYLRSVLSSAGVQTIQLFCVLYGTRAVQFYLNGSNGIAYLVAVGLLGFPIGAIDRGYRAPDPGAFDCFLDVLGDLDQRHARGFRAPNAGSFDHFLDILG